MGGGGTLQRRDGLCFAGLEDLDPGHAEQSLKVIGVILEHASVETFGLAVLGACLVHHGLEQAGLHGRGMEHPGEGELVDRELPAPMLEPTLASLLHVRAGA